MLPNGESLLHKSCYRTCLKRHELGLSSWTHISNRAKRLTKVVDNYNRLNRTVRLLILDPRFAVLRESFDAAFPEVDHFTDIKKLDVFLWQSRHPRALKGLSL